MTKICCAIVLALLTLTAPASISALRFDAGAARVCDAKAKTAKLSFGFKDVNGNKVSLADFKGKVIILDFWATWCVPCRAEIPEFINLQAKYGAKGLQILGLSVDDPVAKLKPYVAEMKMNYPVLQGLGRDDVLDAYAPIASIPTSVVIGRDGKICTKHTGIASMDVFEKEIEFLLAAAATGARR
jgi:cytochrome c biogenesis protein CcmG/thiol:disulfide interchange protein DsbE